LHELEHTSDLTSIQLPVKLNHRIVHRDLPHQNTKCVTEKERRFNTRHIPFREIIIIPSKEPIRNVQTHD
jgi:hypothetical protein